MTKIDEVRDFLIDQSLDIFLIQETHLSPDLNPKFPNYYIYRDDRKFQTNKSGGTCVLVKRTIAHRRVDTPLLISVEATIIEIPIPNSPPITIISGYIPPGRFPYPSADLNKLMRVSDNIILAGDLNAAHINWGNHHTSKYGKYFYDWTQSSGTRVIAPPSPTHFSARSRPTIIDLALFKNIPFPFDIETIQNLNSDHLPVILRLQTASITLEGAKNLSTNWNTFSEILADKPLPLLPLNSIDDAETALMQLNQNFKDAKNEASKLQFRPPPERIPEETRLKIRKRNHLRRVWQNSRDTSLREQLRRLQYEIKSEIKIYRNESWQNYIESLNEDTKLLWKALRNKRKPFTPIPPLSTPSGHVYLPKEKAEAIADSLEQQFIPHDIPDNLHTPQFTNEINNFLISPPVNDLEPATAEEVLSYIKNAKPKKAPGLDEINNLMIKNAPLKVILYIVFILNFMMKRSYFPNIWKTAVIVPIGKPNLDHSLPSSFRPISLLSSISKIYEFILLNRLSRFCEINNLIMPEQFGFRKKHSTLHQLLRVTETIHNGFRRNMTTGAIFLDVAKAFDRVFFPALLYKLKRLGFSAQFVHIINSFLSNRAFRVRVNNAISNPRLIHAGVPQGSLLSPLLFSIYINDIPKIPKIDLACYADDTAIITQFFRLPQVLSNLQLYLNDLMLWLVTWKIKINASKSVAIIFHRNKRITPTQSLVIFNEPIPWAKDVKYLGLNLNQNLNWRNHIQKSINKAKAARGLLQCYLSKNCHLSLESKLLSYTAIIRPILTYGIQIWFPHLKTHRKKLQNFQNTSLRQITKAGLFVRNEVIHKDLKIDSIFTFSRKLKEKFFLKIEQIPNPTLHTLPGYDSSIPSSAKRPRAQLSEDLDLTFPLRPAKQRRLN